MDGQTVPQPPQRRRRTLASILLHEPLSSGNKCNFVFITFIRSYLYTFVVSIVAS